jgi:hypothetical protein
VSFTDPVIKDDRLLDGQSQGRTNDRLILMTLGVIVEAQLLILPASARSVERKLKAALGNLQQAERDESRPRIP